VNSAPRREAVKLWLGLGSFLFLAFFGPRRNDGVLAGVGDGLAEMFAEVAGDHEEGAANGSVLAKQFLRVVEVSVFDGKNGAAEMGERVLEGF